MKSTVPEKKELSIEDFVLGEERAERRDVDVEPKEETKPKTVYPWETERMKMREDVLKTFNIRLPEPYLLKLRFIGKNIPDSMHQFCLEILKKEIDKKVAKLTSKK